MKKLVLAICTIALTAIAVPTFAEDATPAADTTATAPAADTATPAKAKARHHKRLVNRNKHKKHHKQTIAKPAPAEATDTATDIN